MTLSFTAAHFEEGVGSPKCHFYPSFPSCVQGVLADTLYSVCFLTSCSNSCVTLLIVASLHIFNISQDVAALMSEGSHNSHNSFIVGPPILPSRYASALTEPISYPKLPPHN